MTSKKEEENPEKNRIELEKSEPGKNFKIATDTNKNQEKANSKRQLETP